MKFRVIHELEERLPAAVYAHEWDLAEQGRTAKYQPLTHVEIAIPWFFAGLYVVLILFALFG